VRNRKNSRQVPYTISHEGQLETVLVDQRSNGGSWRLIAQEITFDGSGLEYIEVSDVSGRTTADAIRLVDVAGGAGAPATPATTVSYVHNDHLGTPQAMTDAAGNVVWRVTYDPFGSAAIDPASTQTLNVRFPGQYHDDETGLHYNYFRYYDPQNGRYITADPRGQLLDYSDPVRQVAAKTGIEIPQRNNFGYLNQSYGYVDSNPVNRIDPTGEIDPVTAGVIIWGLLYINHAGDAIGQPNGNLIEYFSGQDEACSLGPLGPVADSCPNILNRCIRHDDCYELNECNATSWVPTLLGGSKSCNQCNTGFFSPLDY
jgi:RHS repeat-associated protein